MKKEITMWGVVYCVSCACMLSILVLQLLQSTIHNHSKIPQYSIFIDLHFLYYSTYPYKLPTQSFLSQPEWYPTNTLPKRKGHAKSSVMIRRNRSIDVVHIRESLQKRNATRGGDASVASSERKLILTANTQRKVRES